MLDLSKWVMESTPSDIVTEETFKNSYDLYATIDHIGNF